MSADTLDFWNHNSVIILRQENISRCYPKHITDASISALRVVRRRLCWRPNSETLRGNPSIVMPAAWSIFTEVSHPGCPMKQGQIVFGEQGKGGE